MRTVLLVIALLLLQLFLLLSLVDARSSATTFTTNFTTLTTTQNDDKELEQLRRLRFGSSGRKLQGGTRSKNEEEEEEDEESNSGSQQQLLPKPPSLITQPHPLPRRRRKVLSNNNQEEFSQLYRESIKADALLKHLEAFQLAAASTASSAAANGAANHYHRGAGSIGWNQSVQYVVQQLTEVAGYTVLYHNFTAPYYEEISPSQLEVVIRTGDGLEEEITVIEPANYYSTFFTYKGSGGSGTVQAKLYAIESSACNINNLYFAAPARDNNGGIVLIKGDNECSYNDKIQNAIKANVSGILLINKGKGGAGNPNKENAIVNRFRKNYPIPILFGSTDLGRSLKNVLREHNSDEAVVELRITTNTLTDDHQFNQNIIVETRGGNPNRTIVIGAHLDSVFEGPGINDNGSGCAALLELAIQLQRIQQLGNDGHKLQNKIRFIWWSAEEFGLIGSRSYVEDLAAREGEISKIAMYINMDMIGSTNFVRFILDGDGSNSLQSREPRGQPNTPMAHIESTLHNYFFDPKINLPIQEEPLSTSYGYTDHTAFYDKGIPVTDLHTGIGGIPKTQIQVELFGGNIGEFWDSCYHESCDSIANVNLEVMVQMTHAAAHVLATYGLMEERDDLFSFVVTNDEDLVVDDLKVDPTTTTTTTTNQQHDGGGTVPVERRRWEDFP